MGKGDMDPLLLIPMFILDFLCIHPFNDGNWEALVSASQAPNPNDITSNTQWSIVYDNTNLTADISIRRDWNTVTKYSLKENKITE